MPEGDRVATWLGSHPRSVNAALAAIVLAMYEMPAFDPYRHDSRQWWPAWGLLIAGPLLWRRSRPVAVLALSLAGAVGALLTRSGPDWGALSRATILIGPAAALAGAAATLPRPMSQRLAVGTAVTLVVVSVFANWAADALVAQLVVVTGAWAIGEAFRARRHEIVLLHELVDRRAEQAADAERNRIARELHDVVAHQLSVIAIQAGANRLAAGPGSPVAAGLQAIEKASRDALSDVRRALGVLRTSDTTEGIAPQPGLELLDQLAGRLRDAGLPVELSTAGDITSLPTGIGVSAYRIIQEALTNVLNHAGAVATHVRVARDAEELRLDVHNDPPATGRSCTPDAGGGRGLLGMRERVAAYHGALTAGPLPGGGFQVTARIPLP